MFAEFSLLLRDVWFIYKGRMVFLVALMSLVAIGEGVSVALIFPLLTSIGITGSESAGVFLDTLNSLIKSVGLANSVYTLLALVTGAFFLQFVLNVIQAWWIAFYQRDYTAQWQRRLFQGYIYAQWTFFTHRKTGELVNTITTETSRLGGAFYIIAQMAATIVLTAVYLALAFALSWQATTAIVFLAAVLFLGLRGIGKKSYQIGVDLGKLNAKLNVQANEYFGSAKLIKATATEYKAIGNMEQTVDKLRQKNILASFLPGMVRAIFEFSSMVALSLMLVLGYTSLNIAPANILLVLALFVRLLPRFNAMQQHIQYLNIYLPAMGELKTILDSAEKVSEKTLLTGESDLVFTKTDRMNVELHDVSIEGHLILSNIKLRLPVRGVVGIVGKSGAGKSTLVHSILGLVPIQKGDIRIGDISIQSAPLNLWRRHIGYVPQETLLFHESVKDNISWGGDNVSMEDIRDAARRANANDFIEKLPNGYETLVGDQGAKLSGGQRQRIGIARALLNQPEILLLDEATSALDSASERTILDSIKRLSNDICVVSISHKLSSLRGADQIIVMDNGTILDQGSWSELLDRNETFQEIASAQHFNTVQDPV